MRAVCYVFLHPEGPRLKKYCRKISETTDIDNVAPSAQLVTHLAQRGWQLCNWHIVNLLKSPQGQRGSAQLSRWHATQQPEEPIEAAPPKTETETV